ncbi:MAG TPA: response regulator [Bryobacteraceae bacterium]|nr:response regulator [Bryobacteraceae bacterium]
MARIFIVEDEILIVEDLKNKLRRLGHNVVAYATTGEAAVRKVTEMKPELVLMDVRLRGEINGIEAVRRIREALDVPVVYITAHAKAVADIIGAQRRQFCLTKPFTVGQLESVIAVAFGSEPC